MATKNDIVKLVKVKLEELSPAEVEEPTSMLAIANNDVKPIDSYIRKVLHTAYDDVLLSVPLYKIRTFKNVASSDINLTVTDGIGEIDLPINFLRLKDLHVDCWKRDVTTAISTQHPNYLLQRNKFTRGGFERPIAVINGDKIELYSVKDSSIVDKFHYVEQTPETKQDFDDNLTDLLVLRCAIKVLEIFGETQKSQIFTNEYISLIQALSL